MTLELMVEQLTKRILKLEAFRKNLPGKAMPAGRLEAPSVSSSDVRSSPGAQDRAGPRDDVDLGREPTVFLF